MNIKEIPSVPFEGFKWKWASLQCTEGLNDPVVLLGVLFRMAKLEGRFKYSSSEFAKELVGLADDLEGTGVNVNIRDRIGERNLIRNSGQYWRALNLISPYSKNGMIELTDFGRKVANHDVSQTEFSAYTIISFQLPNRNTQTVEECERWKKAGVRLYPLKLLLLLVRELGAGGATIENAYITNEELTRIVIPMSANPGRTIKEYVEAINLYRNSELDLTKWPDCCPASNDKRIAREFLLFLSYYGYLNRMEEGKSRDTERFSYNYGLDSEIEAILKSVTTISEDIVTDAERKIVERQTSRSASRPNQARFRRSVLAAYGRCVITDVDMPEVLEAAHIKPYQYHGADTVDNGFMMRMDIHYLFDAGHLRISDVGEVFLSNKARLSYGNTIPHRIFIPDHVNREYLKWRWDNYNGL